MSRFDLSSTWGLGTVVNFLRLGVAGRLAGVGLAGIYLTAILAGAGGAQAASPGATVTPVYSPTSRIVTPVTPADSIPNRPAIVTPVALPRVANTGPVALPQSHEIADRLIVIKHLHELALLRAGHVIARFSVRLGHNPVGAKIRQGDGRTPEGSYMISGRDPESLFTLALHISYPNAEDRARARRLHVDPGGAIEIHGQPFIPDAFSASRLKTDWTAGCIALSNADMERVWDQVEDGTPIDIRP
jgi:lipoprotein-anchoring transpeptidase ErfK/SrfK